MENEILSPKRKKKSRFLIFIILFILAIILWKNCTFITYQNEYGVIRQFGRITKVTNLDINTLSESDIDYLNSQNLQIVNNIGLNFKIPFIQSVSKIPKTMLIYDLPISDVITMDKKNMVADSFILWEISNPVKFIKTLSGSISNAESRLSISVYNSMKNVMSSMSQGKIIENRDGNLAKVIQDNLGNSFDTYGITIKAIETKHLDLPQDNKQAVYDRMISERENIAAQYQAEGDSQAKVIRNETDKEVSIKLSKANSDAEKLIAEGEAEYMKILSNAYSDSSRADFYEFVRALDSAKKSLNNAENKTLILDKDSPIAKIFYNVQ